MSKLKSVIVIYVFYIFYAHVSIVAHYLHIDVSVKTKNKGFPQYLTERSFSKRMFFGGLS